MQSPLKNVLSFNHSHIHSHTDGTRANARGTCLTIKSNLAISVLFKDAYVSWKTRESNCQPGDNLLNLTTVIIELLHS